MPDDDDLADKYLVADETLGALGFATVPGLQMRIMQHAAGAPTMASGANIAAFNVGNARFCSSTLARKANAGDMAGACAELSRWTYAGGKPLPGLVKRRATERAICESQP